MIAQNIKAIEGGIGSLTKSVGGLDAAVMKLGLHTNKVFERVMKSVNSVGGQLKLGQGGSGNVLGASLAAFSYAMPSTMAGGMGGGGGGPFGPMAAAAAFGGLNPQQQLATATAGYIYGRGAVITGAAQMAMAPFSAAYGATMDTNGIVQQAGQFFQLGRRSGVGNRAGIERATFNALRGGITGPGSMGNAAAILGASGYTAGTTNYLGAMNQIRNAAISTGMTNEAAAGALGNLQSGTTAAMMYQYGITTMTPQGKMRSVGDIARQINRVFASGAPMTPEQINMSFQRGNLGQILQGLNLDPNTQQLMVQALVDLSQGRDPDKISQQDLKRAGNDNPFSAQMRIQTSQTGLQIRGERNALTGLDAAASTVETFNRVMGDVIVSMQGFKSYLDGVSGTNAGAGIKAGASSFISGAKKVIGGVMIAAGVASSELGVGIPLAAAGTALIASSGKGGGRPGYGGSFGGPRGGGNPGFGGSSYLVSAAYGMKDNSGIWASTGGTHLGTDFAVPVGTPIYATKDGFVSSDSLDKDYGNAVLVEHSDGYQTLYAHLSKRSVSPGDAVLKGQEVGLSGKSGNTTGPALHYEVRKGKNNPVDPSELMGAGSPLMSSVGFFGNAVPSSLGTGTSSNSLTLGSPPKVSKPSDEKLLSILQQAGFSGDALTNAYNIAKAESGGRPNALNDTPGTGDYSMGIFQINMIGGLGQRRNEKYLKEYGSIGYTGPESLYDPLINAKIAYDISKGGNKWSDAWVNSSRKLGIGGGNPGFGASMPQTNSGTNNVYITVKFDQANESNVIQFANRVQDILDSKNNHKLAGGS